MKLLLRSLTPSFVRRFLHRLGVFMGDGVVHDQHFLDQGKSLRLLRKLGLQPAFALDIGAYHGDWTVHFKSIFPDAKVLMFEPQESKASMLRAIAKRYQDSVLLETCLLGRTDNEIVTFYEMETGSSIYAESSSYARTAVSKPLRALDALLVAQHLPLPDFIKMDVQGYEMEVLLGAEKALANANAVLIEVSLLPINKGCPLIKDIMDFFDARGFTLMDVTGISRRNDGVLWQMDVIFLRTTSPYRPAASL